MIFAFFATPLGGLVLRALGVLALGLILLGMKHGYDEDRRAEGRAEFAAVSATCADALNAHSPKTCAAAIAQAVSDLAQAKSNAASLQGAIGKQNTAIADLERARDAAKARAASAEREADDNAAFYTERLKYLQRYIATPSENPNEDADRILRALAIDRVRSN